ncbi:hypothetical protein LOAG_00916 [Loa loa]|uniref:Uncharacterized protein n=1 Tax=Loa loa TaxID=7209 RepID=A0A1S0UAR0_LOALO|nr:hypothetical protein LOAG_00916 [Loa loa]EFO27567.1 hypothetical protein LOAG_00916 [Loa loa]
MNGSGQFNLKGRVPSDANGKLRNIALRILLPAVRSHFTTSWGIAREILIPRKFRQYETIGGSMPHKTIYSKYESPTPINSGYTSSYHPVEGSKSIFEHVDRQVDANKS